MTAAAGPTPPLVRLAAGRGRLLAGGVDARHAFSRGDAIDRAWMGWGVLRVLSTQAWAPGAVGASARIANMELVLLVLDGRLRVECAGFDAHEVAAGGVAWIGAGHGIDCRLANASATAPMRMVEAWIQPDRVNAAPDLRVRGAAWIIANGGWTELASGGAGIRPADVAAAVDRGSRVPGGSDIVLRQDARLRMARLEAGASLALDCAPGRRGWLQLLEGDAVVDGQRLAAGDGLAWTAETSAPAVLTAAGNAAVHALLFELPG